MDLKSPFLFIIAAEGLNIALEEAMEKKLFSGIRLPNNGPEITHLQYADDVLLFGKWSWDNAKNLTRILRCFDLSSGLKVNMLKSTIIGFNTPSPEIEAISRSFGCAVGSVPFMYLGLPVGAPMSRVCHWYPLIEKFKSRLTRWKAKSLLFGGRLTLCKTVLGSLGLYYFSLYQAPVKVLQTLEQIRMRFFWGGDLDIKKIAWIAWDKVLAAKNKGGLGIGSLKGQNYALLAKWHWKFKAGNLDLLWVQVISAIHGGDGGFSRPYLSKRKSSRWGNIANLPKVLPNQNLQFQSFLFHDQNLNQNRDWSWSLEPSKSYTVSSFNKYIDKQTLTQSDGIWNWNHLAPRKLNILIWRVLHGRLPTLSNLAKRGIGSNPLCLLCNSAPEDEDHTFAGCLVANSVWAQVCGWFKQLPSTVSTVRDILKKPDHPNHNLVLVQEAIAMVFIWVIWSYRNDRLYSGSNKSHLLLANEVQVLSHLWINARKRKGRKSLQWINWCSDPFLESCVRIG